MSEQQHSSDEVGSIRREGGREREEEVEKGRKEGEGMRRWEGGEKGRKEGE